MPQFSYPPRFSAAVAKLLKEEGGYVDDPADRGGATNFGISLRFLASEGAFDSDGDGKADFDLDMDGDIDGADIRRLTRADATALYFRCFWQRINADLLPAPIGEMVFDQAVNAGRTTAVKLLQRAVNFCIMHAPPSSNRPAALRVDASWGHQSREALVWVLRYPALGMPALTVAYRDAVAERYRDIVSRYPAQARFLKGWLARARELGK